MHTWWHIPAIDRPGRLTLTEWQQLLAVGRSVRLGPSGLHTLAAEPMVVLVVSGVVAVQAGAAGAGQPLAQLNQGDVAGYHGHAGERWVLSAAKGAELHLLTIPEWHTFLEQRPLAGVRLVEYLARRLWLAEERLGEKTGYRSIWRADHELAKS